VSLQGDAQLTAQIENVSFEFPDPRTERMVSLTAADRKWMDDIVHTVEETWGRVSYCALDIYL
jgi:hypothetical protein